jgi:hypothetical protein
MEVEIHIPKSKGGISMQEQKVSIIRKEPIMQPWIWISTIIIVLIMVPWYYPQGSTQHIILGFPLWALVSLLMAVALSALISYALKKCWIVEEEGEGE